MAHTNKNRRVVVTGIGAVTCLGNNAEQSWKNIRSGQSGIDKISKFDASKLACQIAGQLKDYNPSEYISERDIKKMDPFIHFGLTAAHEAIQDCGYLPQTDEQKNRIGVMLGSGIGGLGSIENTSADYFARGKAKTSPHYIPSCLINLLSGHVSIKYGCRGPNSAISSACASGAQAIGDASRIIAYGDADIMIAGSSEAPITPTGVAGFSSARALTCNYNDNPSLASRPWDKNHSGFVISEGAGVVVLEEYEHAKARGAKIYAEIIGYGQAGDAHHITTPNGIGATLAMENAIRDAQIQFEDIGYINAHGTSTKLGDIVEIRAVQALFKNNKNILMSSTKSSIGHLLGAAGSVETIISILALRDQIAPPTLNLDNPLDEVEIDLVPHTAKSASFQFVLTNSFGFGGTNATLILKSHIN